MYGNYLGLNSHKRGAPGSSGPGGSKYGKQAPASASTRCQKCNALGHYTYECKGQREYKVRPTRTQILKNPKLRTPLTESVMARTEEMPKEGTAAAILAANEAKRAAKAKLLKEKEEEDRGRSRRRRSVSTSSSGSCGSSRSSYSSGSSRSRSGSGSRSRSRSRSRSDPRSRSPARQSRGRSRSASSSRSRSRSRSPARSRSRSPAAKRRGKSVSRSLSRGRSRSVSGSRSPVQKKIRRDSRSVSVEGKGKARAD